MSTYIAGGSPAFYNEIQFAVADVIALTHKIVGSSNIKGLWAFDATSGTTVKDRSGNGHDVTLSANANTLIPHNKGFLRGLYFNGTNTWSAGDSDDFSLTDGAGNDLAGSYYATIIPYSTTSRSIIRKDNVSGENEWCFYFAGNPAYGIANFIGNATLSAYIYRYGSTSLSGDINSVHQYLGTYSGSELVGGLKIYRDGARFDTTNGGAGSYIGMPNTTSVLSSYTVNPAYNAYARYYNSLIIKGLELTATQAKQLSILGLGATGTSF